MVIEKARAQEAQNVHIQARRSKSWQGQRRQATPDAKSDKNTARSKHERSYPDWYKPVRKGRSTTLLQLQVMIEDHAGRVRIVPSLTSAKMTSRRAPNVCHVGQVQGLKHNRARQIRSNLFPT